MTRAFCITDAFWFTIRWISNHWWKTRTRSLITVDTTLCIWTTRGRLTGIWWWSVLNDFNLTSDERIAGVTRRTCTNRVMISDLTNCIDSTSTRTRIYTFLVIAGFVLWTFWACDTFWSTSRRSTNISGHTRANCLSIDLTALRIGSTRRRLTRIDFNRSWSTWMFIFRALRHIETDSIHTLVRWTLNKSISTHSRRTRTHWNVIDHITDSILTTWTRARINTFVPDTRFISRTVVIYDTFRSTHWIRIALVFR